jgi:hypothetical protein
MGVLVGVDEPLKKHENPGKKEEEKAMRPNQSPDYWF